MFPNINNMKIYLVCGKTDLRKGIDGLAALVTEAFSLDAYDNAIFLFCGTRSDRFKALYWDETGFVLYYKRIENDCLLDRFKPPFFNNFIPPLAAVVVD